MRAAEVSPELITRYPDLEKYATKLGQIGEQFSSLQLDPVHIGEKTVLGLSYRCKAMANANLLRGEELFRFSILALNEGAVITAYVLCRALYETLAFVVFARREIGRKVKARDVGALENALNRLTSGNSVRSKQDPRYPKPYHILDVLRDAAEYLDEFLPDDLKPEKGVLFDEYDFKSEFAHPNQGSFALYQRLRGNEYLFTRETVDRVEVYAQLLSALRMSGYFLLREAAELAATPDLPPAWLGDDQSPAGG